ncbi:ribosomal protein S18 acetylase RimI-like enzyme [Asanoa ferruginea]|uniref:Ribosomal protein S18 acetylase RimI-like enzyme n=1 Tax=Asanoa ferruginea TaxID=53367 RepID=A0A3D9ZCA9_9ACTN|nr:GNAT family N-acetyltransferase [Asanoa ferruginea]REF94897.1 ribosomal protein S18 acetylase RimI-like enzyme [Asanoa ferruginea]GIF45523.1 N-acetyltransferase [Asanoa ferruginea]
MTTVRPGTFDDAASLLAIRAQVFPWQVNTVAGLRHGWELSTRNAKGARFAVDDERGMVGFARADLNIWTSEEGAASATAIVRPDARGKGIGTALLAAAEEHLRSVGARKVVVYALDDPDTLRFAEKHGYTLTHSARYQRLLLADLPPVLSLPAGVTIATAAEIGPEALFAVDAEAMADEPSDTPFDKVEYDDWREDVWEDPNIDKDLSTVVLVDGEPATMTYLYADRESGRFMSTGTGTRRAFRGRGLAKIAKSVAFHAARDAGFTAGYTGNDETNKPMLAINEWLGYQPIGAERSCVKVL